MREDGGITGNGICDGESESILYMYRCKTYSDPPIIANM